MPVKNICLIIILTALFACEDNRQSRLISDALIASGDNRSELQMVLDHFQDDSLKLAAAQFLIANMPGHYSYADTVAVNAYSEAVDSLLERMKGSFEGDVYDSINQYAYRFHMPGQQKVMDCETVRHEYLIRHIDQAVDQWKNGPWAQHLSFDDFCEYLLPYKVEELQPLDDWRAYLSHFPLGCTDDLHYYDFYEHSAIQACTEINNELRNMLQPINHSSAMFPHMKFMTRMKQPFGSCDDYAILAMMVFRSHGIPVVLDFTPQWAYRSLGHSWNVLLANDGRKLAFCGVSTNPGDPHKLDEKMPKAFRHTYAFNPVLRLMNRAEKYVPSPFNTAFLRDVTDEYISVSDVHFSYPDEPDGYAYLSVFDDADWKPVAFGEVCHGEVTFEKMGRNILYLPVRYDDYGHYTAIGLPFVLDYEGKCHEVNADMLQPTTLRLTRKYPALAHMYPLLTRVRDGEFQESNDAKFKQYRMIHRIEDCTPIGHRIDIPDSIPPYRYWRYVANGDDSYGNMAEISFHATADTARIRGRIIGTEGSWVWNGSPSDRTRDKMFDGDVLTIFDAPLATGAWAGMDFGHPVRLHHILYTGRGDGNAVELGDLYELFVWVDGRWKSLGRKIGDGVSLTYEQVPSNGLYLLRDLTKGREERIFTYSDGEQIWW